MDGMGEEKFYFHPFNSVKSQKAPFGQIVATNFVTDCSLSAFYRPLAWQNKIMGWSFLAIYAVSFHAPCLISASKEAWPRALETVGGIFPLQRWRAEVKWSIIFSHHSGWGRNFSPNSQRIPQSGGPSLLRSRWGRFPAMLPVPTRRRRRLRETLRFS